MPPCSDSELAVLLDRWTHRAESREPLALAMARAFARETAKRIAERQLLRGRGSPSAAPRV
ncbi:MAG: hypothetical protein Q4G70_05785 [Pseudomonadota bacterium]|nr:hypothetical protein [Pseudomonadota bacterium]